MNISRTTSTVPQIRQWLDDQTERNRGMVPYSWLPFDRDLIARRCAYCDRHVFLRDDPNTYDHITEDHVIPRSRGGTRQDNIVVVCRRCNSDKGVQLWLTFLLTYRLCCRSGLRSTEIAPVDQAETDRIRARRARKRKRDKSRRALRRSTSAFVDPHAESARGFRVTKLLSARDGAWSSE